VWGFRLQPFFGVGLLEGLADLAFAQISVMVDERVLALEVIKAEEFL
jgi:hypothetical protein